MKLTSISRYQAFASHLAISLIILAILSFIIVKYWYTGMLFEIANGWKAIGIIAGVDIILGPLLTLFIFNPNKKSLPFDLSTIALIQIVALMYGTWTIHQSRPVAITYLHNGFSTLYANAPYTKAIMPLINSSNKQLVYKSNPDSTDYKFNPKYFKSYSQNREYVLQKALQFHAPSGNEIQIPIKRLKNTTGVVRIAKDSGEILGFQDKNRD